MKIAKTLLITFAAGLLWSVARAGDSALTAPVKSVYDHYLKIHASLAGDSMAGVAENAEAIAQAVRADANALPSETGAEAEAVAKAADLAAAREAFKPLSDSLIHYLANHKAKGGYVQFYCSMARASWLQADKNVRNPYLGKEMSGCGEIQN